MSVTVFEVSLKTSILSKETKFTPHFKREPMKYQIDQKENGEKIKDKSVILVTNIGSVFPSFLASD
jgi:hypothetical protein